MNEISQPSHVDMPDPIKVSVVIATLGTKVLGSTLDALAEEKKYITEILVVFPSDNILDVDVNVYDERFRFIPFPGRGQVSQRIFGFNMAQHPLVLQMDDDCILTADHLHQLVGFMLSQGEMSAVAPSLYDPVRKVYPAQEGNNGLLLSVLAVVLFGAKFGKSRMGTVSKAGNIYPMNPLLMKSAFLEAEWLPGGCVMHWKKNIIDYNYFPFSGRACLEDVIHCHLLRCNGVKLYVARDVLAFNEGSDMSGIEDIYERTRIAMKYLNVLRGYSNFRVDLWYYLVKLKLRLGRFISG